MLVHPGAVMLTALCLSFIEYFELTLPDRGCFLVPSLPVPSFAHTGQILVVSRDLWEKIMSDSREVVEMIILVISCYQLTFYCC